MAQAGRRWQRSLFPFLIGLGYTQFGSDPCLFRKTDIIDGVEHTVLVGVYVDDLAIVYSHDGPTSLYGIFSTALTQRWEVEDEGPITDLLNIEFDTSVPGSITIHQQSFINGLVELHGTKLSARLSPEHTVLPFDGHLAQHVIDAMDARNAEVPAVSATELRDYQSIVGAMLYCSTNTRPDIAYPISMLCRCMSCPTYAIIGAAQHLLRYLERTDRLGLTYSYVLPRRHDGIRRRRALRRIFDGRLELPVQPSRGLVGQQESKHHLAVFTRLFDHGHLRGG